MMDFTIKFPGTTKSDWPTFAIIKSDILGHPPFCSKPKMASGFEGKPWREAMKGSILLYPLNRSNILVLPTFFMFHLKKKSSKSGSSSQHDWFLIQVSPAAWSGVAAAAACAACAACAGGFGASSTRCLGAPHVRIRSAIRNSETGPEWGKNVIIA